VYHSSAIYGTSMPFLNCKFTIGEATSSISQIYIEWDGYNTAFNSTSTQIRIWDFNSSSWTFLDGYDGEAEVVLSSAITSNFGNYISGGYLYAYAVGRGAGVGDPPSVLYSDFIKVVITYTGDSTPPAAISNLTALTGDSAGTVKLKWTAPGDDGTGGGNVNGYLVKYATFQITSSNFYDTDVSTYTDAYSWTPGPFGQEETGRVVSGLSGGTTYYFAIKAYDDAENGGTWSTDGVNSSNICRAGYKSVSIAETSYDYGSLDIESSSITASIIKVTNDGNITGTYEIKCSGSADWDVGSGTPAPDQFRLLAIFNSVQPADVDFSTKTDYLVTSNRTSSATVFSGNQTGKDVPASSDRNIWFKLQMPSNSSTFDQQIITVTITNGSKTDTLNIYVTPAGVDSTPPAAISNLTALTRVSTGTVKLKWTAPGDDGTGGGNVNGYLVKYATFQIITSNFYNTYVATYTDAYSWTPGTFGQEETGRVVSGLDGGTTYYFAIKAKDEADNWGTWSTIGANSANYVIAQSSWSGFSGEFVGDFSQSDGAAYTDGTAYDLVIDTNTGNVYVAGSSSGKFFIIKYNSSGVMISSSAASPTISGAPYGIALDTNTNVYVTGGHDNNFVTVKYNSDLSAILSSTTYSGGSGTYARAVAVDNSGNIYVTGRYNSGSTLTIKYDSNLNLIYSDTFAQSGVGSQGGIEISNSGDVYVPIGTNSFYVTIVRYDSFLIFNSSVQYNTGYTNSDVYDIAIDNSENIYVTGRYGNGSFLNWITVKYSPDLVFQSSAIFTNGLSDNEAHGIKVANSGDVYVTGRLNNGSNYDYLTVKYNSSLVQISSSVYDSGNNDGANGITLDESGNIYVTGGSDGGYRTLRFTIFGDLTSPAAISNLTAMSGLSDGTVRLKWIDPGDDGTGGGNVSSYEVKYATFCIDSPADYSAATTYSDAFSWPAGTYGTEHQIQTVSNLANGTTYWFAIKATDDSTNQGIWPGSYVFGAYTSGTINDINCYYAMGAPDSMSPAAVSDLAAETGTKEGEVDLTWSVPGDDDWNNPLPVGSEFRIQHSTASDGTGDEKTGWMYQNTQVQKSTSAVAPETQVSYTVTGLDAGVTYYFKIGASSAGRNLEEYSGRELGSAGNVG